jgi:hypothetical protein
MIAKELHAMDFVGLTEPLNQLSDKSPVAEALQQP